MAPSLLVLYGSYRSDRIGIRLAHFLVEAFVARSAQAELIDARAIGLPMLDRMYKEYPAGTAPKALETLAGTPGNGRAQPSSDWPGQPSDAESIVSPTVNEACMMRCSLPGGTMFGSSGSGQSLKRSIMPSSAPMVLL